MIIAEIGHNWLNDLRVAQKLIIEAAKTGVDVIKFQLYNTDRIKKPQETNYKELKMAELTKRELYILYKIAESEGVEFLVSIFDEERFDWIEELGIELKRHKIASRTIRHMPLIDKVIDSGLPIIVSLGDWDEEKLPTYFPEDRTDLLYCKSRRKILQEGIVLPATFGLYITGFSDHTVGVQHAISAIDRGAKIIEKHFTLDHNWPGWDQPGSATPEEMKQIVEHYRSVNG